jgi:hypothetical protein
VNPRCALARRLAAWCRELKHQGLAVGVAEGVAFDELTDDQATADPYQDFLNEYARTKPPPWSTPSSNRSAFTS